MHRIKEGVYIWQWVGIKGNCLIQLPVVYYLSWFLLCRFMMLPVDDEDWAGPRRAAGLEDSGLQHRLDGRF